MERSCFKGYKANVKAEGICFHPAVPLFYIVKSIIRPTKFGAAVGVHSISIFTYNKDIMN